MGTSVRVSSVRENLLVDVPILEVYGVVERQYYHLGHLGNINYDSISVKLQDKQDKTKMVQIGTPERGHGEDEEEDKRMDTALPNRHLEGHIDYKGILHNHNLG